MKLLAIFLFLCLCSASAWAQVSTQIPLNACTFQIVAVSAAAATDDGGKKPVANWQAVTLPNNWTQHHPNFDGGSIWYRIDWRRDCPDGTIEPAALLLSSVVLAGEVFVGEHQLFQDTQLQEPLSRSWNMPRRWILPETWLHDGVNTLWVRVVAPGSGQSAGLGAVLISSPKIVEKQFDYLMWNHRILFEINVIVSGLIGVFFFFIWVLRRDQSFYGWYAASSLFWLVFISNILMTNPWPFLNSLSIARVNSMALLLCVVCFYLFSWRFGNLFRPRLERLLWGVTFFSLVALAAVPNTYVTTIQSLVFFGALLIFLLNCAAVIIYAWRSRQLEYCIIAACFVILFLVVIHDTLVFFNIVSSPLLFIYINIALTLAFSTILGLRHARSIAQIERFNEEMEANVTQARSELAAIMERDHALILANTRRQDRIKMTQDLHDGLGSALVHMITSIEEGDGSLTKPQVLLMLQFIRDNLRQTIDNNNALNTNSSVTPQQWIAPLRQRFTLLFDEMGVKSHWHFPEDWSAPPNTLQYLTMTRLIEEGLTNIIKHSHAREVQISLNHPMPDILVLEIEDDGVGFDVAAVRTDSLGGGMSSMAERIARVGGIFDVTSRPGSTILSAQIKLA